MKRIGHWKEIAVVSMLSVVLVGVYLCGTSPPPQQTAMLQVIEPATPGFRVMVPSTEVVDGIVQATPTKVIGNFVVATEYTGNADIVIDTIIYDSNGQQIARTDVFLDSPLSYGNLWGYFEYVPEKPLAGGDYTFRVVGAEVMDLEVPFKVGGAIPLATYPLATGGEASCIEDGAICPPLVACKIGFLAPFTCEVAQKMCTTLCCSHRLNGDFCAARACLPQGMPCLFVPLECCEGLVCQGVCIVPGERRTLDECTSYLDCGDKETCEAGDCVPVPVPECGYVEGHIAHRYECCKDADCFTGFECSNHNCVPKEIPSPCNYNGVCEAMLGETDLNCPSDCFIAEDTDGDGISDSIDKCPTIYGYPEYEGCPRTANDCQVAGIGIIKNFDSIECVAENGCAGRQTCTNGQMTACTTNLKKCQVAPPPAPPVCMEFCPGELDADRDGVPDNIDSCPDTPFGTMVDERGCPAGEDITMLIIIIVIVGAVLVAIWAMVRTKREFIPYRIGARRFR